MFENNSTELNNETNITSNKPEAVTKTRMNARFAKKSTSHQEITQPKVQPKRLAALASKDRLKMMENFNPDLSNREKKKLERKLKGKALSGAVYDSEGIHISTNLDLCDCLDSSCPGCFFRCKKCSSTKCGPECRSNRKTVYESVEYHGFNHVKKNPLYIS